MLCVAAPLGTFTFDGRDVPARPGDTLGAALHREGILVLGRSLKYHRPRGLACCTGSCASCLVEVDGEPNVPACIRSADDAKVVRSQNRIGTARHDLLGVVDKVYPTGFDPHGAFTRPRIVNEAFLKAVRFMSGVGRTPRPDVRVDGPVRRTLQVEHLVVGGGRHGVAAAQAGDAGTLLVDEQGAIGGSALWDPSDGPRPEAQGSLDRAGVEVWNDAVCFGLYGRTAAIARHVTAGPPDLWEVEADRITVATGRHDGVALFPNNDLPGVLSLRGARRLLHGHGVLPGRLVAVHGRAPPDAFTRSLEAAGGRIVAAGAVEEVRGGTQVERALVDGQWHSCDAVVVDHPGTPRIQLLQQAGCALTAASGVLAPVVDEGGRTGVAGVYAAFTLPEGAAP